MEAHCRLPGWDAEEIKAARKALPDARLRDRLLAHCASETLHARETPLKPVRFSYGTNVRLIARISHLPEDADLVTMTHPEMLPTMNIGETIRNYRLQKGMSQGDIEKRTGLLRC